MNLPVILDIVIGLIFIYLSFSLLASEIQAILTTILQWRATHLKKSIEELISGQTYVDNNNLESDVQIKKVQQLANSLYQNKLIKGIETVNTRVEYRFIPRNIYEDQFGSPNLEQSFQDMFENQDVFFKTV